MKPRALAPFLVALAALAGCSAPSTALRGLAQDQHDDVVTPLHDNAGVQALEQRSRQRADKVRRLLAEENVGSAADHYNAALVLVQCTRAADLELAHQQALAAAELGEQRGLRVAAEALDKLMLERGLLQRYGTQFVWEPVLRSWRLYAIDPHTSDAERQAMGVPPLEELKRQEAELNRRQKSGSKSR
jgi:hypothetical protein